MKPLAQVYEESVWSPMPEAVGHRDRHNRALEAVANYANNFDGISAVDKPRKKTNMPKLIVLEEDAYNKLKSGAEWLIADVRALYAKLIHHGHTVHANPETAAATANALEAHIATVEPITATAPEPVVPTTLASLAVPPPPPPAPVAAATPPPLPVVPVGVSAPSEAAAALAS